MFKTGDVGAGVACLWVLRREQRDGGGEGEGTHTGQGPGGLRRSMAACLLYRKKSVPKGKEMPPSRASGPQP